MCGIGGIANLSAVEPPSREALERMAAALDHRGPDDRGVYRDAGGGLAHTRLSIIDLDGGHQPLCNEDGSIWCAFNGEIFNYLELRAELVERGHRFRTRSDTEVIVHAWEQWGEGALERMSGQWAFALWEPGPRRLTLSRDRLGIRPLYHAVHAGRVIFASTVRALFAGEPALSRELDPDGIDETFTFWSVVPPQTVFRGVSELEPGHVRIYQGDRVRDRAYWTPRFPGSFAGSIDDAAEAVDAALERATALRMLRADVPVGCYLSGGLDSSLTAAMALAARGEGFHTFSLRFADAEYDEGRYQQQMVERLGSIHHEVIVERADIARVFPEVIAHTERPILRTAPAPLFLLSERVRDAGIKVVLTGEGADEVFAGYDLFREGKIRRFWARRPESQLRPLLLERLYPYMRRSPVRQRAMARSFFGIGLEAWREPGFAHQTRWRTTAALKRLLSPEMATGRDPIAALGASFPAELASWSPLAQDQYLEMRTLLAGYLLSSQGDRMLMSHSIEGRFPFLDRDVVELASTLPDRYKLPVLDEKHVLKRIARRRVPAEILDRKKQPYRAPDVLAFTGDGAPGWIDEVLDPRAIRDAGVFRPEAVERLWRKCRSRAGAGQVSNSDNMALVGVLSTQLVHETLIRRAPDVRRPARIEVIDEVLR